MILIEEKGTTNQYYLNGSMLDNTVRTNILTSHPTIEGTSFSDHYYRESDSVSFALLSSDVSKPLIYSANGAERRNLTQAEVKTLLLHWFNNAPRLRISTLHHFFDNMVMKSYSWSETDLALFNPTVNFSEARVQYLRTAVIENPDQYYQAAYGGTVSLGNSISAEFAPTLSDAFQGAVGGAIVGGMVGSIIPGVGTGVGALIGGGIGFFGALFS